MKDNRQHLLSVISCSITVSHDRFKERICIIMSIFDLICIMTRQKLISFAGIRSHLQQDMGLESALRFCLFYFIFSFAFYLILFYFTYYYYYYFEGNYSFCKELT